jgi:hypothetical protein
MGLNRLRLIDITTAILSKVQYDVLHDIIIQNL